MHASRNRIEAAEWYDEEKRAVRAALESGGTGGRRGGRLPQADEAGEDPAGAGMYEGLDGFDGLAVMAAEGRFPPSLGRARNGSERRSRY